MNERFNTWHALALITPVLHAGEQILARARGYERPWCGRWPTPIANALSRGILVVATNQRLLLLEHTASISKYTLQQRIVLPWPSVERVCTIRERDGALIEVEAPAHRVGYSLVIPGDWLRGNVRGAEAIAELWRAGKLGAPDGQPSQPDMSALVLESP